MNVDEALFVVENLGHDLVSEPAAVLANEVRRLQRELARYGGLPLVAAWKTASGELDQLMYRRPDGRLLVLTRDRTDA